MKRTLIAFGLFWIIVSSFLGMYLGMESESYNSNMTEISQKGDLAAYWNIWSTWKSQSNTHAHALGLALVVLLTGAVLSELNLTDKMVKIMGILLISGTVFASIFQFIYVVPLMALGDVLILAGLVIALIGVMKK